MEIEERVKALEDEFRLEREKMRQILLDIRTYLMEASTPLRHDSGFGKQASRIKLRKEAEQHGAG